MDGATANFNGSAKRGVVGVVRNHEGFLTSAMAKQEACDRHLGHGKLETEIFAFKTGLEFALDCSFVPLIGKSNCLEKMHPLTNLGANPLT